MNDLNDKKIIASWNKNAAPWIKAIENNDIESRRLVTNRAIVEAVSSLFHQKKNYDVELLDLGCGEGWLVREFCNREFSVTGIDVSSELIATAKQLGAGHYRVLPYEELSQHSFSHQFDIVVCNFSLLGKESVEHIFNVVPLLLKQGGYFVVQTLHPVASCGSQDYVDGWRKGSWDGFSKDFTDPAPWYFRTLESWKDLFVSNDLNIRSIQEPLHPNTNKPASLLLVGQL